MMCSILGFLGVDSWREATVTVHCSDIVYENVNVINTDEIGITIEFSITEARFIPWDNVRYVSAVKN